MQYNISGGSLAVLVENILVLLEVERSMAFVVKSWVVLREKA